MPTSSRDGSPHPRIESDRVVERFPLSDAGERWLAFLPFEHAVLPLPADYGREGDDFLVWRDAPPRRRVADGRIPGTQAASLFLQAAAFFAVLESAGFGASEDDLEEAAWETVAGSARLCAARTPSAVRHGPGSAAAAHLPLVAFLERAFARRGRVRDPEALRVREALSSDDAPWRRAEFWVGCAYRCFPALSSAARAGDRLRTIGAAGSLLRGADVRARLEKGRALLQGKAPRIFLPPPVASVRGAALQLSDAKRPEDVASRVRVLREQEAGGEQRPRVWICVGLESWDAVSRASIEAGSLCLPGLTEVVPVADAVARPSLAEEWRREIAVPCGAVRASVRFSQKLAEIAAASGDPSAAVSAAREMVAHEGWGPYVADPTGHAPLPPAEKAATEQVELFPSPSPGEQRILEALESLGEAAAPQEIAALFPGRSSGSAVAALVRRGILARDLSGRLAMIVRPAAVDSATRSKWLRAWAAVSSPERRVERLLRAGDLDEALGEARALPRGSPLSGPGRWFDLSAQLAAAASEAGRALPPWLEALEGERELSGGRAESAESRFRAVAESPLSDDSERRTAGLRLFEIAAQRGRGREAALAACAWRDAHPEAPPAEMVRALLVEAAGDSRDGETGRALARLDEAELLAGPLPPAARLEVALSRAAVLSRAGRLEEEAAVYAAGWPLAREAGDERLAARLLASEALGLADRREFDGAIRRLEEALAILRDDPVERAKLSIDLAATLYHAGRPDRCPGLLEHAASLAVGAGRGDLARIARSNLVEASTTACDWESASRSVDALLQSAERDGDRTWLLVGLHHRARLALRVGRLEDAGRDNVAARELARQLDDRLEIGELWLEEGDRCALLADEGAARRAWEQAAADPPDRCHTDDRASRRLAEQDALAVGGIGATELHARAFGAIERGEYGAAEGVARWSALCPGGVPRDLRDAAGALLRSRGGALLADRAFPTQDRADRRGLELLREAVALGLSGEAADGTLPFGLAGLSVTNDRGEEVLALGVSIGASNWDAEPLRAGADEYVLRLTPPPPPEIARSAALVVETLLFRPAAASASSGFSEGWRRLGVVAGDAAMEEPYRRLVRFAPRAMTVLILGESGSGKEAVARAVHDLSPRASGPFVAVNVSAIPATLLESELFGHARGAFTGADRERAGLLEESARGTIFFDEIGDLARGSQAKLLRALQDREIRRVGENRARRIDVRVVSATSRDLAREVDEGRFREDLFYRLHVAVVRLPPLRDRGHDILLLARHFVAQASKENGRGDLGLSPDAVAALLAHSWPGNVRELQSAIGQAAALAEGNRIDAALLPEAVRRSARPVDPRHGYRTRVDAHRRDLILEALERSGGNRSRAARELKLSRQALLYLIRELKVTESPRGV
ncbi:MAG: sigma-54 dependent transcriptional regulator [Acidobacteriota bacterium]